MGSHIVNGEFQSDKYPTCPPGKVPLSVKDPTAQDLLWEYAQRRRAVDAEFAFDLEMALAAAGFVPPRPQTERHYPPGMGEESRRLHREYNALVEAQNNGAKNGAEVVRLVDECGAKGIILVPGGENL
jgi:hypothetical protein